MSNETTTFESLCAELAKHDILFRREDDGTYTFAANRHGVDHRDDEASAIAQAERYLAIAEAAAHAARRRMIDDQFTLPRSVEDDVRDFVEHGRTPMGLVLSMLRNEADAVITRSSGSYYNRLRGSMLFILNRIPQMCWGSRAKVDAWLALTPAERAEKLARSTYRPADQPAAPAATVIEQVK